MNTIRNRGVMFGLIGMAAIAVAVVHCDSNFSFIGQGSNDPDGTRRNENGDLIDSFTQPSNVSRSLDAIFVKDTSPTMFPINEAVGSAISNLVEGLGQGRDICVGVLLGHAASATTGKLMKHPDVSSACLCTNSYNGNLANFAADFKKNFIGTGYENSISHTQTWPKDPADPSTDGGEALFLSFYNSLTREDRIRENTRAGCFRPDAALAVINISDENELSTAPDADCTHAPQYPLPDRDTFDGHLYHFSPAGHTEPEWTECGTEQHARLAYYSDSNGNRTLGAEQILAKAREVKGVVPFLAATVGYINGVPTEDQCCDLDTQNKYPSMHNIPWERNLPEGYMELSQLSGGDLVDIADITHNRVDDFNAKFKHMGEVLASRIAPNAVFDLSEKPCSAGAIHVTVDGNAVSSTWDGNKRVSISAADAGGPGSVVEITYSDNCQ